MELNDKGIAAVLGSLIEHLQTENSEQAELFAADLPFQRLVLPMAEPMPGDRRFFDPARRFGVDRVHETGDLIQVCKKAIQHRDRAKALACAEAAITRWSKKP